MWSLGCVLYEMITLKPPFQANDMQGLYKKVLRGIYPALPAKYSSDLNYMIKALLQTNPRLRPTCDQIIQMPTFLNHLTEQSEKRAQSEHRNDHLNGGALLDTIKLPRNLHMLKGMLPKKNYEMRANLQSAQAKYGEKEPLSARPGSMSAAGARGDIKVPGRPLSPIKETKNARVAKIPAEGGIQQSRQAHYYNNVPRSSPSVQEPTVNKIGRNDQYQPRSLGRKEQHSLSPVNRPNQNYSVDSKQSVLPAIPNNRALKHNPSVPVIHHY